jgi:hypothetical protein
MWNAVATGDFDHNGRPDFAVTDYASDDFLIFLGNGDGTFQNGKVSYGANNPRGLAVGDFNHDGNPDVAVADGIGDVRINLGNGDGTIKGGTLWYVVGFAATAVAVGDFNRDGKPDVAVTNGASTAPSENRVSVLLGNGDGSLQAQKNYIVDQAPLSVVTADFNGDGALDLATTNGGIAGTPGFTVSVLLGAGDGTFGTSTSFVTGTSPVGITTADFNRDGHVDLATANGVVPNNYSSYSASVLLGTGSGRFIAPTVYAVPGAVDVGQAVTAGDFNGDCVRDLAVAGQNGVSVFVGHGDGTYAAPTTLPVSQSSVNAVVAADWDSDGKDDLVVSYSPIGVGLIQFSNGDGTFQQLGAAFNGTVITTGDFNEDGRIDEIIAGNNGYCQMHFGDGSRMFSGSSWLPGGCPAGQLAVATVADVNGDGHLDLIGTGVDSALKPVFQVELGDGKGHFSAEVSYPLSSSGGGGTLPVAGDFDGNGTIDLASSQGTQISVVLGDGHGAFGPPTAYPAGLIQFDATGLYGGDFNGDGTPDLVVFHPIHDIVGVLFGKGDGTFQNEVGYPVGQRPASIVVDDLNRDGNPDIAVTDWLSSDVMVLKWTGCGGTVP